MTIQKYNPILYQKRIFLSIFFSSENRKYVRHPELPWSIAKGDMFKTGHRWDSPPPAAPDKLFCKIVWVPCHSLVIKMPETNLDVEDPSIPSGQKNQYIPRSIFRLKRT